jgi:hypothetical protein
MPAISKGVACCRDPQRYLSSFSSPAFSGVPHPRKPLAVLMRAASMMRSSLPHASTSWT